MTGLLVLKVYINLSMFKQPKHCIKMAPLMLLLPTKATTEEKTNTSTD